MESHRRATGNDTGVGAARRIRTACVALCLAALSVGTIAQEVPRTTVLTTGLHSFYRGHVARTTVAEIGARTATSRVRIDYRDDSDRLIARKEGVLSRTVPVRLDLELAGDVDLVQVRVVITIIGNRGDLRIPVATLEDLDPLSLSVEPRVFCSPVGHDSAQTVSNCPGWAVTNFTPGG